MIRTLNEDELLVQPNACAVCDWPQRHHYQLWHADAGYHGWQEPSDQLRLARMLRAREARFRGEVASVDET